MMRILFSVVLILFLLDDNNKRDRLKHLVLFSYNENKKEVYSY